MMGDDGETVLVLSGYDVGLSTSFTLWSFGRGLFSFSGRSVLLVSFSSCLYPVSFMKADCVSCQLFRETITFPSHIRSAQNRTLFPSYPLIFDKIRIVWKVSETSDFFFFCFWSPCPSFGVSHDAVSCPVNIYAEQRLTQAQSAKNVFGAPRPL